MTLHYKLFNLKIFIWLTGELKANVIYDVTVKIEQRKLPLFYNMKALYLHKMEIYCQTPFVTSNRTNLKEVLQIEASIIRTLNTAHNNTACVLKIIIKDY